MNLSNFPIPSRYHDLLKAYESYYHQFYLEMVRTSNSNFVAYVKKYFNLLLQLSRHPLTEDSIRAAIGVVCLHQFGYQNFNDLTSIFDRLIPQLDGEYIQFTSWCVGRLIHHPNIEESQYARSLFMRALSWTRSKGRRARPLAAAYMLQQLSQNCGSVIVSFFPQLQTSIWSLVSYHSIKILQATASAIAAYTRALYRYGRDDLNDYMDFFTRLCLKLLFFDDSIRQYGSLCLLEELINEYPDYYVSSFLQIVKNIVESTEERPLIVQGQAFSVLASLSAINPQGFIESIAEDVFGRIDELILEFPVEMTNSLCRLCETIPEFINDDENNRIEGMIKYSYKLMDDEPDCTFQLLAKIIEAFHGNSILIEKEQMIKLINLPLSINYKNFFITVSKCQETVHLDPEIPKQLCTRLIQELTDSNNNIALDIFAKLPPSFISNHEAIFKAILPVTDESLNDFVCSIPNALFNLCKSTDIISTNTVAKQLLQYAIYEPSIHVRCSILEALIENTEESFADNNFLKYYEMFMNDDSSTVRDLFYRFLIKLAPLNPLTITSITRTALLNSFFIIKHVPSIRKKAKTICGLPILIQASAMAIKAYTKDLLEIFMDIFRQYNPRAKFENFLEEDAQTSILIGIMQSLQYLAPLDREGVSKHANSLIPILCDIILSTEHRLLILNTFDLLFILLSAHASTLEYRIQVPYILSTCSNYLAQTHSRKGRMAAFKVLGAIGIAEVHPRPPSKGTQAPANMDEDLARMFFHPTRDAEGNLDDYLLLLGQSSNEQYYLAFIAKSLLQIFNDEKLHDLYEDTVRALVEVLHHPKMPALFYFDAFVARLLTVLEKGGEKDIETLLPLYSLLISNSTHNTSPFLKRSLKFVHDKFNRKQASMFIDLILAFLYAVRDGFEPYASETICLLVVILDDNKTCDCSLCEKVLEAFGLIGFYSANLLYLSIPQISDAIITEQTLAKVRIAALETLTKLARNVFLLPFMAPIARSLKYCFLNGDQKTLASAFELLFTLLQSQGVSFLVDAQPLIEFLKREKMETPELKYILNNASQGKYGECFHPLDINKPPPPPPSKQTPQLTSLLANTRSFSSDAIIAKAEDANHMGRHLDGWLNSFILCVISNSPSQSIRSCTVLATSYLPLAKKLFNVAFLSVWKNLDPNSKQTLSDFFQRILDSIETFESIAREIINLIFFMEKVEQPMNLNVLAACLKCGNMAFALKIQEQVISNVQTNDVSIVKSLIDIYVKLGQWQNAVGVWKQANSSLQSNVLSSPDVFAKLRMWDKAEPLYKTIYQQTHSFESFRGMIESLSSLAKWPRLIEYMDNFKNLELQQKKKVSIFFAEAAINLGKWDDLSNILEYAPDDMWMFNILLALNALHKKEYDKINDIITKSFSLLASKPLAFSADNQQIHQETMLACQELIEVDEIREWLITESKAKRDYIEEVWNQRLQTATRDFNLWFSIFVSRVRVAKICEDSLVRFFQLRSPNLDHQIHLNAFNILFPDYNTETASDAQKLCHSIALWNIGKRTEAVDQVRNLTNTFSGNLLMQANFFYSSWLLEDKGETLVNLRDAFNHLKMTVDMIEDSKIIQNKHPLLKYSHLTQSPMILPSPIYKELMMDTIQIDILRKWSDVNALLISVDKDNKEKYAINAITALSRCTKLAPSFPDGVAMLNIFFENAENKSILEKTSQMIVEMPTKLLLQSAPQIEIQLSHSNKHVRSFVQNLIFDLLRVHYHDLMFSLLVLQNSRNSARARVAGQIIERLHAKLPEVYNEGELIRTSLLRAAVTWAEKVQQRLSDANDFYQRHNYDKLVSVLQSILQMVSEPCCEMHDQFKEKYANKLQNLEQYLAKCTVINRRSVNSLVIWCSQMQAEVSDETKRTRTIQLSAISSELAQKENFKIAVFGTYRPNHPVNRIKYFVGQLSVYMSKQVPKDVVIKGEDGNFYQYLLKGHEDLRLDERIMQFFGMINSLLTKESSFLNDQPIQTISVIPLSMSHGLVQWATQTDTFRAIIEQYRKMHSQEPMAEYLMADANGIGDSYDFMQPIQKTQIIEQICQAIPDTDLANFFWLKSSSTDVWIKKISTFSISTAVTSIVGYIVGLGDRHPSNLLIDRITGRVVHIDFGDCFERASLRKYLPETVPFRLTRMMVKALGPGGVEGIFKTAFINMSSLLRANKQMLLNVLSIFVHEPLIDPDIEETESIASGSQLSNPSHVSPTCALTSSPKASLQAQSTTHKNPYSDEDETSLYHSPNVPQKSEMQPPTSFSVQNENSTSLIYDSEESKNINQLIASIEEMKSRIRQKLTGTDFPSEDGSETKPLTDEEQATVLIKMATDPYNLAKMYSGWCPFW